MSLQHACITVTSGEQMILVLIDTGSDVTLAGRLLAEQFSWDYNLLNSGGSSQQTMMVCRYLECAMSSRVLGVDS